MIGAFTSTTATAPTVEMILDVVGITGMTPAPTDEMILVVVGITGMTPSPSHPEIRIGPGIAGRGHLSIHREASTGALHRRVQSKTRDGQAELAKLLPSSLVGLSIQEGVLKLLRFCP